LISHFVFPHNTLSFIFAPGLMVYQLLYVFVFELLYTFVSPAVLVIVIGSCSIDSSHANVFPCGNAAAKLVVHDSHVFSNDDTTLIGPTAVLINVLSIFVFPIDGGLLHVPCPAAVSIFSSNVSVCGHSVHAALHVF
jgi:hypothetical protein